MTTTIYRTPAQRAAAGEPKCSGARLFPRLHCDCEECGPANKAWAEFNDARAESRAAHDALEAMISSAAAASERLEKATKEFRRWFP